MWNYYRDEQNIGTVGNGNYSIKYSKSFNNKTSITGKLENNKKKGFWNCCVIKVFKDTINPLQLFVEKCQFFNQNYQ